jgi:8-oxo-dGTP pyrophosphatase MutT (NUDIX family)
VSAPPAGDEPAPGFGRVSEDEVYRGHIIRVARGTFSGPDGSTFTRDVVHHPGAVAVVPVRDDGRVVLVRQYRAPIDELLLELPAGLKDVDGEPPIETAQRELIEETGFRAGRLELLVTFTNSAGFCDEQVDIFLATGLEATDADLQGIEEQHMTIEDLSFDEALDLIDRGELHDSKTIIGLLLARRRLGR